MNPKSLEMFTTIAYRCLKRNLEERPLMTEVVNTLESALEYQYGLLSSDSTHNPNQSSSYEQGNTTQEESDLMTTKSPHITQTPQVLVLISLTLGGWDVYDSVSKKWTMLPEIPIDQARFTFSHKESLSVGSQLLVFGRERFGLATWKYNFIRQNWVMCEGMNHPRSLFGSANLGSIAIVAGGSDQNGNILKSAELYYSSTGRWEILPDMDSPRNLCSGFFMDEKFYVIGGRSTNDSLNCGEEFDLNTKKWKKIHGMYPNVNMVANAYPLVAVVSDEVYAVEHLSNMVKKYNKNENSWEILGRLPKGVSTSNGWGVGFMPCGEGLVVVGGQKRPQGEAIVLNYWSPKSGVVKDGVLDWKVIGVKEHGGTFVYNCAVIMGC